MIKSNLPYFLLTAAVTVASAVAAIRLLIPKISEDRKKKAAKRLHAKLSRV